MECRKPEPNTPRVAGRAGKSIRAGVLLRRANAVEHVYYILCPDHYRVADPFVDAEYHHLAGVFLGQLDFLGECLAAVGKPIAHDLTLAEHGKNVPGLDAVTTLLDRGAIVVSTSPEIQQEFAQNDAWIAPYASDYAYTLTSAGLPQPFSLNKVLVSAR